MEKDLGNPVPLNEKKRTYIFPGNNKVELDDVIELIVRPSGTHRLKTKDKKLHIIPVGWIHIEISEEEWTV